MDNESRGTAGGLKDNTAVMVAVESLPGRGLGRVRLELAEIARSSNLVGFAMRVIEEGSTIKTDGATNLQRLAGRGYRHERFVGVDSKEPANVNLPGVHMVGSLLKRRFTGTLHYAVSQEHLAYYLDEYTFRFNRTHLEQPRPAVLSTAPASREHRPPPAGRAPRTRCRSGRPILT